jgi:hypothetical protein
VLQVGLMRVFLWSLGPMAPPVPWLDLAAIAGYAFVGVALNLLVGVALGSFSYSLSLVWTCMALGYCMFRQMQQVVPAPEPGQRGRRRRLYFLVACVILQVLVIVFLGYSRELRSMSVGAAGAADPTASSLATPVHATGKAAASAPVGEDDEADEPVKVRPKKGKPGRGGKKSADV